MKNYLFSILCFAAFFSTPFQVDAYCEYSSVLDITASKDGNILSWITLIEVSSAKFEVERSSDGVNYVVVGELESSGTTRDVTSYTFIDRFTEDGDFNYRLKEVDTKGKEAYSKEFAFNRDNTEKVIIEALTPLQEVESIFDVLITVTRDQSVIYEVKNDKKETILMNTLALITGANQLSVDLSNLEIADYKVDLFVGQTKKSFDIHKNSIPMMNNFAETKIKFKKIKKK